MAVLCLFELLLDERFAEGLCSDYSLILAQVHLLSNSVRLAGVLLINLTFPTRQFLV
jgi:hypothetical protein